MSTEPRPPKDLPTSVVNQARDISRKLDVLLEQRRGQTAPPPPLLAASPKPA